jgi:hypothetical protein
MEAELAQEWHAKWPRSVTANRKDPWYRGPGRSSYEFRLVGVRNACGGGLRLLRWELDKLACQDSCRAQRDIEPNKMPRLPGIEVTQRINVSVKASARIE